MNHTDELQHQLAAAQPATSSDAPEMPVAKFSSWHAKDWISPNNPDGACNAFARPPERVGSGDPQYWVDKGYWANPLFTADQLAERDRQWQARLDAATAEVIRLQQLNLIERKTGYAQGLAAIAQEQGK